MKEVLFYLGSIRRLSPVCIAYLSKVIQRQGFRKGDTILEIGDINERICFVTKGILHCRYYNDKGSVSAWFFGENKMVVSIGSFYNQSESEDEIVALEDGELYYITKEEYDHALDNFPEFARIATLLYPQYLVEFEAHARLIRKVDVEERYRLVLERYPDLVLRIPVGALASWLNMDPSTLSRMRAKH